MVVEDVGGARQDGSGPENTSERSRLHLLLSFSLQEGSRSEWVDEVLW